MKSLIKSLLRAIFRTLKVSRVILGKNRGFRMRYRDDLNLDMLLGIHEPNTFEVFDLFIRPGMVVADIGANVGYFSRFLSHKVGDKGKVFAFEPIPSTFQELEENIRTNGLQNITTVNKAVTDHNGSVTMYLSHTHYMASTDSKWAGESKATEVPAITLDSFFEEKGFFPDFIKMDIEGGGVYALQGMVNCITRNEPVLFLESHTSEEDLAIGRALQLADYEVYRVGESQPVKFLDRDYTDPYGISGTVIGIPKSKKNLFGSWTPAQFQKNRLGQRHNEVA